MAAFLNTNTTQNQTDEAVACSVGSGQEEGGQGRLN